MRFVFSPWRLAYVTSEKAAQGCVFCAARQEPPSPDNLVVYRDERIMVMLNRYPYTNGHMMVVPHPHVDSLTGLDCETRAVSAEALAFCETVLRSTYCAHGINVGLNLGQDAGAGIADHLHWHILPRWQGDTNFVPVLADVRVVPQALMDTYKGLVNRF